MHTRHCAHTQVEKPQMFHPLHNYARRYVKLLHKISENALMFLAVAQVNVKRLEGDELV